MSNIVEIVEKRYRDSPYYGVTFSIDADAYECEQNVEFGESTRDLQCGTFYNWQDILLDGQKVGYLMESKSGRLFDPMCVSFIIPIADCTEPDVWADMENKYKDNPHLWDTDEVLELRFATLKQFIKFIENNEKI